MARLITSGFDLGHQQADGHSLGGSSSYDSSTPLSGARSIVFAGGNSGNFTFSGGTSGRDYYCRARVRINTLPSARQHLLSFIDGATNSYGIIAIDTGGQLRILPNDAGFNGSELAATITVSTTQVVLLEIMTMIDTGGNDELRFRIDGVEYGPFTGAYGSAVLAGVTVGPWLGNGGNFTFDDFAINDDQGASENTWCGDRKVVTLRPASDPGTSDADWQKPGGSTSNRHTSVDSIPPVFETYDSTSGSAEDYLRNAASGANQALNITLTDYTTAGVGASDVVKVVQPLAITGSSSATNTAGDVGLASNPTIAQASFTAFDNGVASSTATTWPRQIGTVTYAPSVTKGTGPVITVTKVTSTTRVAIVNCLALIVEYEVVTETEVTLTQATETDTAQALVVRQNVTLAPATETGAAQALVVRQNVPITQATETDAAQALTVVQNVALTAATEVDSARRLSAHRLKFAAETDAAQALVARQNVVLTPATETGAAQALVATQNPALTPATETGSAQALTAAVQATLTPATETDAAFTAHAHRLVTATETDAAQALTARTHVTLTAAAETDAAQALTVAGGDIEATLTPATETDAAQALVAVQHVTLTPAVETGTAQALVVRQNVTLTAATETDSAQAVTTVTNVTLTPATETDAAQAVTFTQAGSLALTPATETDAAQALASRTHVTLTPAVETGAAFALTVRTNVPITHATEADAARGLVLVASPTLTPAAETDAGQSLTVRSLVTLTHATETDEAVAILGGDGIPSEEGTVRLAVRPAATASSSTRACAVRLGHRPTARVDAAARPVAVRLGVAG